MRTRRRARTNRANSHFRTHEYTVTGELLILSCVVALSSSMRLSPHHHHLASHRTMPAIRHEEVHDEFSQYAFRYITAENTVVSERGRLVASPTGDYVMEIEGIYSFIGDDDQFYFTKYRGGVDGFHVEGTHLPRPVPAQRISRNKIIH